ncbi:MAG TPA: hypothetical protein VJO35_11780 [Terriglobales bacterium]|nr:hypothetical protein [Terriglobales bacterium]
MSPILAIHISGGTLGLFSGAAALLFRKGSRRHALAGKVFVFAMLTMAAAATYLAVLKHQAGNINGGIFTFYLILTAWFTIRRPDRATNKFDWIVLLIPLALGLIVGFSGIEKMRVPGPSKDGVPAGMNFFLSSVMLLAAAGDVRMLVRGGVAGSTRIARHLWRMCFGLFVATGSFFLGPANRPLRLLSAVGFRQQVFRTLLRQEVLLFLAVLPLFFLIFWLVRVRLMKGVYPLLGPQRGRAALYGRVTAPASVTRP